MTTLTIEIPENKIDILSALKTLLRPFQDIFFKVQQNEDESWDTVFTEENRKARKKGLQELKNGETLSIEELKKNFIKDGYAL